VALVAYVVVVVVVVYRSLCPFIAVVVVGVVGGIETSRTQSERRP
jgi:hypothetical protein